MGPFSLPDRNQLCRRAPGRSYLPDAARTLAVPDHSIGVPAGTPRVFRGAEWDRGASYDGHSLELTLLQKSNFPTVRRKERFARILGAPDGHCIIQTVQRAQVQLVVRKVPPRCVPCGEIARTWRPVPAPRGARLGEAGRANRTTGGGPGTRAGIRPHAPMPPRTAAAKAVSRKGTARRQLVCAIAAPAVAGPAVVSNAPSSIRRTAPMSVMRSFRGFLKHSCAARVQERRRAAHRAPDRAAESARASATRLHRRTLVVR